MTVSLLGGDDAYQISLELESLTGAARRRGAPLLDEEYSAETLDRVFGHLASPSLFAADPPIAVVREADRVFAKGPAERVLAWARGGGEGALVFVAFASGKPGRASENALFRHCEKAGTLRLLNRPARPADWIRWIRARAERFGLSIDDEAAKLLYTDVGEEPGPIDRELEKFSILGETKLDRATLAAHIGGRAEAKIFEASEAYFHGRIAPLLEALPELTENGRAFPRFAGAFQYVAEKTGNDAILPALARLDGEMKSRAPEAHLARAAVFLRRAADRIHGRGSS